MNFVQKNFDKSPETIKGAAMSGRVPTNKEFRELENFIAIQK